MVSLYAQLISSTNFMDHMLLTYGTSRCLSFTTNGDEHELE